MEEPQNLRTLFTTAKVEKESLDSHHPTADVNTTISKLKECHRLVRDLSLFSPNESLEEIPTGDLQYVYIYKYNYN